VLDFSEYIRGVYAVNRKVFDFLQQNTVTPEMYPIQELAVELEAPMEQSHFLLEVTNHVNAKLQELDSSEASCRRVLTLTIALNEFLAHLISGELNEDAIRGMLDSLRVIWRG